MLYALDLLRQCDEAIFQGPSETVQKGHCILVHTLYDVHFDVVGYCARWSMRIALKKQQRGQIGTQPINLINVLCAFGYLAIQ